MHLSSIIPALMLTLGGVTSGLVLVGNSDLVHTEPGLEKQVEFPLVGQSCK